MSHTLRVWFQLVDSYTGLAYKGNSATSVFLPPGSDVADFRKAVKAEYADSDLKGVAPSALVVYKNEDAFEKRNAAVDAGKEEPLTSSFSLDGLGTKEDMLVVIVPSSLLSKIIKEVDLGEKLAGLSLDSRVIRLDPEVLEGSGLREGTAKYLFSREAVVRQMKFLDDAMKTNGCQIAWISGPSGVGKSATTLAYVSHLACKTDWVVSWISSSLIMATFRLTGKTKTFYKVEEGVSLLKWLDEVNNRNHICVLDADVIDMDVLELSLMWLGPRQSPSRRLLVVVAPFGGTPPKLYKLKGIYGIMSHMVPLWTFEEYVEALADENVWNSVKKYIYEDGAEEEKSITPKTKRELIENKYFYAGKSSRCMLDFSLNDLIEHYPRVISMISDTKEITESSIGSFHPGAVDLLYSLDEQGKFDFASKYVVRCLSEKVDIEMIDTFVRNNKANFGPGAIGSMFEMRCHCCIFRGDLEFEVNGEKRIWKSAPVYDYYSKEPYIDRFKEGARFALKPFCFLQGGYDLIFAEFIKKDERTGQLIFKFDFIFFTMFSKHSLYIDLLEAALTKIRDADKDSRIQISVDITFLSPKGRTIKIGDRRGVPRTIGWDRLEPRLAEIDLPFFWY